MVYRTLSYSTPQLWNMDGILTKLLEWCHRCQKCILTSKDHVNGHTNKSESIHNIYRREMIGRFQVTRDTQITYREGTHRGHSIDWVRILFTIQLY